MRFIWSVAEALSNVSNKLQIQLVLFVCLFVCLFVFFFFFFFFLFKILTISNVVCVWLFYFSFNLLLRYNGYVLMDFIELLFLLYSLLYSKDKLQFGCIRT